MTQPNRAISPPHRFTCGYDRWMDKRWPLAAAMRFDMSVPGQILVNTAVFTLPEELGRIAAWEWNDGVPVRLTYTMD